MPRVGQELFYMPTDFNEIGGYPPILGNSGGKFGLTGRSRISMGLPGDGAPDSQRSNANADTAMVVGSVFLWPVLFGLTATADHREEVARLNGEYVAVEEEEKVKACGLPPRCRHSPAPRRQ
jgi:hypothetical protein